MNRHAIQAIEEEKDEREEKGMKERHKKKTEEKLSNRQR